MPVRVFDIDGHIIDSLILAKVQDTILAAGATYEVVEMEAGLATTDPSRARLSVRADEHTLDALESTLAVHGVVRRAMDGVDRAGSDADPDDSAATALNWGRRFLLCRPTHFGVLYEINPWMHAEVRVDEDAASAQWDRLRATLVDAGAEIELIDQPEGVPDLVFTANAGLLDAGRRRFVPSHFRHAQRQPETAVFAAWFEAHGWEVVHLPAEVTHEGAGDALPFDGVLVSGYRPRSDRTATTDLTALFGVATRALELVDERLYHLDLTFCPLDDRRAMCAPLGWDRYGRQVIEALVPEPLWLEDDEALSFCANSVVVGDTIIMPTVPIRVGRILESWGFTPVECPVDEFLKAGGGCRCLTLALDTPLGTLGNEASPA